MICSRAERNGDHQMTLDWRSRLRLTTLPPTGGSTAFAGPDRDSSPFTLAALHAISTTTQLTNTSPQTHVHARSSLSPLLTFSYFTSLLETITVTTQISTSTLLEQSIEKVKCGGADSSALLRPKRIAPATRPVIAVAASECIAVNCDKHCKC